MVTDHWYVYKRVNQEVLDKTLYPDLRPELASHTSGEGHKFNWTHACILQFESNATYQIYKEASHLICSDKPNSQAILENSPIWLPLIDKEINDVN